MQKKKANHYFQEHPKSKLKLGIIHTNLSGTPFQFLTASGVFSKKRVDLGTRVLIESMVLPEKGYVLDVGCGYGAVGIAAAAFNPKLHVVMVDVNSRAVWLAKRNIEINNLKNAEVRHGNLYEPVKGLTFNCILSNPPVSAGMKTVGAIISEAPQYMTQKALFQIVVNSKIGGKNFEKFLHETFGNVRILARKSGYRVFISKKT
ncbi:MAG: class I SAM-dependent methyltransferase [Candidatus Bathyarchaeota archaeon]|jgi:16S rRNA G1207 methylase RsmC|nr:class I SAM-dependent methyltransferase [Candidatus Bathyarchaeota archaeon]